MNNGAGRRNPERIVRTFFHGIFPLEIIPFCKNKNILFDNYIYFNVLIFETCSAQTFSDSAEGFIDWRVGL